VATVDRLIYNLICASQAVTLESLSAMKKKKRKNTHTRPSSFSPL